MSLVRCRNTDNMHTELLIVVSVHENHIIKHTTELHGYSKGRKVLLLDRLSLSVYSGGLHVVICWKMTMSVVLPAKQGLR